MKKKSLLVFFAVLFSLLFSGIVSPLFSQDSPPPPDGVLQISQLNPLLRRLDSIAETMPNQPPPSALAKSFLQGTDWIDPNRSIVIGAFLKSEISETADFAALIPFTQPNEGFSEQYQPVTGADYYIVRLPPQKGGIISDRIEKALVAASLKEPEGMVTLDLALSRILDKFEPQIRENFEAIDKIEEPENQEVSLENIKAMLTGFIDTGRQVKRIRTGMDLTDTEAVIFFNALALPGSKLESLFQPCPSDKALILTDYTTEHHIDFRSKPYDMAAVMDFMDTHFGAFYDQMGIDFENLKETMAGFSGEMAGGFSWGGETPDFELIQVLDENAELPEDYLKTAYVPWILDYGKNMADFINSQSPETRVDPLAEETAPSTVAGREVLGVRFQIPDTDTGGADNPFAHSGLAGLSLTMRVARMDSLILMASDDQGLESLMERAGDLEKKASAGPCMQMDIDLAAYLEAITGLLPDEAKDQSVAVPELGDLSYLLDVADNEMKSRYTLQISDIKKIWAYFNELTPDLHMEEPATGPLPEPPPSSPKPKAKDEARETGRDSDEKVATASKASPPKASPDKDTPQYWLEKGALFATYGNTARALEHFRKAVELDPDNSRALFHLAVSYGEAGKTRQALDAINRAISLKPEEGSYYYARGWIHLLADHTEKADSDMQRAAELGNRDAIDYLESIKNRN